MSKHTPGPWTAEYDDYGDEVWFGGRGAGMWTIHGPNCYLGGQSEANARLIAAAPELLAMLIQLRDEWFKPRYGHNDVGLASLLRDKIRAVIAKAEGSNG